MNLIRAMLRPRSTVRSVRDRYRLGRQFQLLQTENRGTHRGAFYSGLGDSAWLLYALARSLKPEVCVEIGSARGKSACYVGWALKQNGRGKLYAVDPHASTEWNDMDSVDTYAIMADNLEFIGVRDVVEIIRKYSHEAAEGWSLTIDMLFIDGDHTYEGIKRDWDLFMPHVSSSGIVVFHDTAWAQESLRHRSRDDMGVPRFVDELRAAGYPVITFMRDFGVSLVQPRIGGIPLQPHESALSESSPVGYP